jgi:hypothetical protein
MVKPVRKDNSSVADRCLEQGRRAFERFRDLWLSMSFRGKGKGVIIYTDGKGPGFNLLKVVK